MTWSRAQDPPPSSDSIRYFLPPPAMILTGPQRVVRGECQFSVGPARPPTLVQRLRDLPGADHMLSLLGERPPGQVPQRPVRALLVVLPASTLPACPARRAMAGTG